MTRNQIDSDRAKELKLRIIAALVSPIRRKTLAEEIKALNAVEKAVGEIYR